MRPQLRPETAENVSRFAQAHRNAGFNALVPAELPQRETADPVTNISFTGEACFEDRWVADVNIAHPNGDALIRALGSKHLRDQVTMSVERAKIARHRRDDYAETRERAQIVVMANKLHA